MDVNEDCRGEEEVLEEESQNYYGMLLDNSWE